MKKTYLRRVLAVAFVMVFMLTFAMPALAADYVQATQSTNVYFSASSSSSVLGILSKGSLAEKLGVTGIWTKIVFGNNIGYVLTSNVAGVTVTSGSSTTTSASSSTLYATTAVNVRSGPGTKYSIISTLSKGQAVVGKGEVSGWMSIEWNGGLAYVHAAYLSGSSSAASGTWVKATVPLNVRSGPGTKYSIVGGLNTNESVQKLGTSGKWTKIDYKGTTAYVSSSYVTATSAPSTTTTPTTTQNTDLSNRLYAIRRTDIRNGPGSGYTRIGELDAGDYVYYAGSSVGSWYKVAFANYDAYVYSYDVQYYSAYYGSGTTVYALTTTPVYSSMSSSSTLLGYLYSGTSATKYGSSNSTWTGILYNGKQGYVYTSYLSSSANSTTTGSINAYWYATSSGVWCYKAPSATTSNRLGTLSYGEPVWVRYADSTWAECTIVGQTMYVPVSYLSSDSYYSSGYNNYYNNGYAYLYQITAAYSDAQGKTFYGTIPSSARLTILGSPTTYSTILVCWYEGSTYHTGYVYTYNIY